MHNFCSEEERQTAFCVCIYNTFFFLLSILLDVWVKFLQDLDKILEASFVTASSCVSIATHLCSPPPVCRLWCRAVR